ncbi:MAG: hypothetical protein KHX69_11995, partial [Clostridium sp.]|nr:hypothetical protein [Clostridium sp.]
MGEVPFFHRLGRISYKTESCFAGFPPETRENPASQDSSPAAGRKSGIFLVLYSSSVYRPSPRSVCYTVWRYCGLVSFS